MKKLKALIHQADEGGFWAEIPEIPGCCAQGRTRAELLDNLKEAAEGCLFCDRDRSDADDRAGAGETGDLGGETVEIVE